jgi:sirohydrochlorin ferrochelatase
VTARRALVLLDHGSRHPDADRYLQALAQQIPTRRPELAVHIAHLGLAAPSLREALERCAAEGACQVSVFPFFLAPGRHLERDVPEQIARAAAAHPALGIELLEALGSRPELAELVLQSYESAAGGGRASKPPRN